MNVPPVIINVVCVLFVKRTKGKARLQKKVHMFEEHSPNLQSSSSRKLSEELDELE